jgi:hypothetical protein
VYVCASTDRAVAAMNEAALYAGVMMLTLMAGTARRKKTGGRTGCRRR